MRPECGEQKTIGESCSVGLRSVNGGVNSASIEARSLACMSIWEDLEPLWDRETIKLANPRGGGPAPRTLPSAGRPVYWGSDTWRGRVWVERWLYFIARLPNWRQIPRASRPGPGVAMLCCKQGVKRALQDAGKLRLNSGPRT